MFELLAGRAAFPATFVGGRLEQIVVKSGNVIVSHAERSSATLRIQM